MKQLVLKLKRKNKWDTRFVIIPLTSKQLNKQYGYEIPTYVNSQHGKALLDQIKTVDKKRLMEKLGQLTVKEMNAIYEKLLAIFNLWEYLEEKEI